MKFSTRPNAFDDDALSDALFDAAPEISATELDELETELEPLDEEIAAYLDAELAPQERADFEKRLENEPELRQRVDEIRSAWDALELLDADAPNETLTETTVDKLNSETQTELVALEAARRRRVRVRNACFATAAAFLAAVGYCVFGAFFPDVDTQRKRDFRVVERLAQLEIIGDFEYLAALAQSGLFESPRNLFSAFPVDAPESDASRKTAETAPPAPKTLEELSQDRVFFRLQKRFEQLDDATKDERRTLYRQIDSAPNNARLWRVLDNYCAWFSARPNESDREKLLTLSTFARLAEIRRSVERERAFQRAFVDFGRPESQPNAGERAPAKNAPDVSSPTTLAIRSALPEELREENLEPLYQKYAEFCRRKGDDSSERREGILAFLSESALDEHVAKLSESARQYLSTLSEEERASALGLLVSLSLCEREDRLVKQTRPFQSFGQDDARFENRENERRRGDSIGELAETLRNASQETRDYLTSRPADEMRGRLWAIHWGFSRFGAPGFGPNAVSAPNANSAPPFFPGGNPSGGPTRAPQNRPNVPPDSRSRPFNDAQR